MSICKKDYDTEFKAIKELNGNSKNYFRIPDRILFSREMGKIRTALYSYLYIHKGLNDIVIFSVPFFLRWAGLKSDSHKGGLNDKVLQTLDFLSDAGYVTYIGNTKLTKTSCVEIKFNTQLVNKECSDGGRFAIVYIDEVETILNYKNENVKDTFLNSISVLLVFAYLRRCIPRRINKLNPEERCEERIVDRQKRLPEAYNAKFIDIASDLELSERVVSKAIDILRALNLIVLGTPHRIRNIDGEYRTPDFIFSNYQKRDGNQLLASGIEYAKTEINIKAKLMHDYHKQYGVNYAIKNIS